MPDIDSSAAPEPPRKRWPLWKILLVVGFVGCLPCVILTGLMAVFVVPGVFHGILTTQRSITRSDITVIASAIDQYALDHDGEYPDSLDELITLDEHGFAYLPVNSVPVDPCGNAYLYVPPPPGTQDYRVMTYGADGVSGGEGLDRDLDNVMIKSGEF